MREKKTSRTGKVLSLAAGDFGGVDPAFAVFAAEGLAGISDLTVSESKEAWLLAGDLADEGVSDSEGKVGVFDIDVVYHCFGTGLLVANPAQNAFGVCCQARDDKLGTTRHQLLNR